MILSRTNATALATLYTGQKLKVDLGSTVGRSIYLRGVYENEVENCIRRCLNVGDTFIAQVLNPAIKLYNLCVLPR
jgi:hypothetical protein